MADLSISSYGTYNSYPYGVTVSGTPTGTLNLVAPLSNSTNIEFLNNNDSTAGVLILNGNAANFSFNVTTTTVGANLYTSANIGGSVLNFRPGAYSIPGDQITLTHVESLFVDLDVASTASADNAAFAAHVTDVGIGLQYYLDPDGTLIYLPGDGPFTFNANEIKIINQIEHSVFGTAASADNATLELQFAVEQDPQTNRKFADLVITTTNTALNPCFAAGTRILTTQGEIPVEQLAIGDRLITHAGEEQPIIWIGRRQVDITAHPRPETVRPVIIEPGALGDNIPARRTRLSPDHALYLDGVLVPAKELLNWTTIRQDIAATQVEYLHIELARHDVIFAENLPVETYLDTGHRGVFDNEESTIIPHPARMQQRRAAESYAPLCLDGPGLAAIRQRIAARQVGIRLG